MKQKNSFFFVVVVAILGVEPRDLINQESDLPIEHHQTSFCFLFILRYSFIKLSRLALNALCGPGRSRAEDIPASASQAVEITGLYYHTWLQILYGRISANTAVSQLWAEGTCNLPHNVAVAQGKCSAIANFLDDSQEEFSLYKTSMKILYRNNTFVIESILELYVTTWNNI